MKLTKNEFGDYVPQTSQEVMMVEWATAAPGMINVIESLPELSGFSLEDAINKMKEAIPGFYSSFRIIFADKFTL